MRTLVRGFRQLPGEANNFNKNNEDLLFLHIVDYAVDNDIDVDVFAA